MHKRDINFLIALKNKNKMPPILNFWNIVALSEIESGINLFENFNQLQNNTKLREFGE